MNCPKCNKNSKVVESFSDDAGVYRIRKCLICGHRFSTTEATSSSEKFYKLKSDYYNSGNVRSGGKE